MDVRISDLKTLSKSFKGDFVRFVDFCLVFMDIGGWFKLLSGFLGGGMQRSIRKEQKALDWKKKSFSQGIGVTVPKARTRDKQLRRAWEL
ncbi:hypothetical protein MRB53_034435 [Persea americana]|uniref:Uncharacterized protein n=1 Tax=Persea americana TaxID=3435 RepID=A0ACC2K226_PERAE|nr:hypothetical protein MRB53_034435 [Persea americana]